jgi:hypothetical protein
MRDRCAAMALCLLLTTYSLPVLSQGRSQRASPGDIDERAASLDDAAVGAPRVDEPDRAYFSFFAAWHVEQHPRAALGLGMIDWAVRVERRDPWAYWPAGIAGGAVATGLALDGGAALFASDQGRRFTLIFADLGSGLCEDTQVASPEKLGLCAEPLGSLGEQDALQGMALSGDAADGVAAVAAITIPTLSLRGDSPTGVALAPRAGPRGGGVVVLGSF